MPRLWPSLVTSAALWALLGCSGIAEMKETLKGLQTLQAGLVADLQEPNTNVNVTNATLTVTFVNSRLASEPEDQRARTARRVAEFVRDHYSAYARLSQVAVGFQSRASVGVASAARTEVPYSFTSADLGPGPEVAPSKADTVAR